MCEITGNRFYIKSNDGSVVNVRVMANKKNDVFVTGFFNGASNPAFRPFSALDLLESDGTDARPQIIHIAGESKKGVGSYRGEVSVTIFDFPYTTGRKNLLPVEGRIVDQVLLSVDAGNKEAMDKHNDSFGNFYISEGFETAKRIAGVSI